MTGPIVRLLAGVFLFGLGLAGPANAAVDDDRESRDARTVYCLLPEHRRDLAEAVVVLRLVTPGPSPAATRRVPSPSASPHVTSPAAVPSSPSADDVWVEGKWISLLDWRTGHQAAFDKACDALIGADPQRLRDDASIWPGLIGGMVPVAVGALLTLVATAWHVRRDRAAKVAMDLRTAAVAYRRAGVEYIKQWRGDGNTPEDREVQAAQHALEGQLSVMAGLRLAGAKRCRLLLTEMYERQEPPWGSSGQWKRQRKADLTKFSAQCFKELEHEVHTVMAAARDAERLLPRPRAGWGGLRALTGGVRDRARKMKALGRKKS
ncbi:hypothetical protein GCM10009677_44430 [Sphaerisporangium rubeum]|uniref:DUF5129 domain-containing protein n=1 Tax=Sphaerisporangium rubeum TaxID=321317 RepID=A0A7X0ICB0_9ACTN|nr:hypothetical protein [Sphaerisporangium rubeum]MBB6471042.1 hypothetical protein [Sphaerisporangium rubeum]